MGNVSTVEAYMDGFRRTDRALILSCLTDDVQWELPGIFSVRGKDAFATHIVDEGFAGKPQIAITRIFESGDIVVAEGTVVAGKTDGTQAHMVFCDLFEMRGGKISRLISYLMETPTPAAGGV